MCILNYNSFSDLRLKHGPKVWTLIWNPHRPSMYHLRVTGPNWGPHFESMLLLLAGVQCDFICPNFRNCGNMAI